MARVPGHNLHVRHAACPEDLDVPQGAVFAERIAEGMRASGFPDAVEKCYSDLGWSVNASAGDVRLSAEVILEREPDLWLLQLYVVNKPGLLSRTLGTGGKHHATEMGRFASAVHRVLESIGCCEFRWCLDDYPGTGWTSATPFRPPGG